MKLWLPILLLAPFFVFSSGTNDEEYRCYLPREAGRCQAINHRYYYNHKDDRCEKFIYGGCGGNKNNFKTIGECERICHPNVCNLSKVVGPCRAAFRRYYHDTLKGRCLLFTYGGCGGNENNFETIQECQNRCLLEGI